MGSAPISLRLLWKQILPQYWPGQECPKWNNYMTDFFLTIESLFVLKRNFDIKLKPF